MAYSEQYYPKIVDLLTGINRLCCIFKDRAFEYDHDRIYDLNVAYNEELSLHYREMCEKYEEACIICELYNDGEISLECLCYEFLKLDFQNYLFMIKEYMPTELQERFCIGSDSDEENAGKDNDETTSEK